MRSVANREEDEAVAGSDREHSLAIDVCLIAATPLRRLDCPWPLESSQNKRPANTFT